MSLSQKEIDRDIEIKTEELIRSGFTPEDAYEEARWIIERRYATPGRVDWEAL